MKNEIRKLQILLGKQRADICMIKKNLMKMKVEVKSIHKTIKSMNIEIGGIQWDAEIGKKSHDRIKQLLSNIIEKLQ